MCILISVLFFFFKQKTAYEMRISDWSSDVCSSDLPAELKTAVSQKYRWAHCRLSQARQMAGPTARKAGGASRLHFCRESGQRFQGRLGLEIGRASCRERVCQYV